MCTYLSTKLDFFSEKFSHIDDIRREELAEIAERYYVPRMTARQMLRNARSVTQTNMLRTSRDPHAAKGLVTLDDVDSFEWRKPVNRTGF